MEKLVSVVSILGGVLAIVFTVVYFYQYIYIIIALFVKDKKIDAINIKRQKITAIIPARNEELVVGDLIDSLLSQNYPRELVDIVVVADNCTDKTADVARRHGVTVYERFDQKKIGMGYAFEWLFRQLLADKSRSDEVFLLTNADNLFDPNYFEEINKVYQSGYRVVASYRNSKNYGTNWISAGYGLWFIRESRILNGARMKIGSGCIVSGTGYVVDKKIVEDAGGWNWTMLTEDVQFSSYCALNNIKIGYASRAMFYDEQPETFSMSWRQRMRWVKGYLQVFRKDGGKIVKNLFRNWTCYDLLCIIAPAAIIAILGLLTSLVFVIIGLGLRNFALVSTSLVSIRTLFLVIYATLFFHGVVTVAAEWDHIRATPFKKILHTFTLPLFIATYMPILAVCLFKRDVGWKPINHKHSMTIDNMTRQTS